MPHNVRDPRKFPGEPVLLLALFLILASAIAGVGYRYYRVQKEAIEQQVRNQLLSVADFKVAEISDWRSQAIGEVRALLGGRVPAQAFQHLISHPAASTEMNVWLEDICRRLGFVNATVVDTHGNLVLSVGQVFGSTEHLRQIAGETLQTDQLVFRDLHFDQGGDVVHIGIGLPLRASRGDPPFGVLILAIDPAGRLYPMLQRWPVPNQTAEALLVRQEGDQVVFLSDLRFRKNAALRLRLPMSSADLPSVQGIRGARGNVEGLDYRGVPVFAAVRPVPDTSWFLIAKMDTEEVEAPIRRRMVPLIAATISLILVAATGVFILWRRQRISFHRARQDADMERQALVGHYESLSRYANDIVLMIDNAGRIVQANDRAASAYGYSREELTRMTVRDLRHASSMVQFDDQWKKVSERGSLVFESVHQTREGRPFPVEVSVRFIRTGENHFRQSIIRDISERKAMDEKLRGMVDAFSAVIDSSAAAIITLASDLRVTTWNKAAEKMFGWTSEQAIGMVSPFIPAERMEKARLMHERAMQGEVISGLQGVGQCADGHTLHVSSSAAALHDSAGNCTGVVLNIEDVTEHTRAEEALRRNEALYRATFDQAAVGMNYVSLDGRFLRVNPRYCEITGYCQEELLAMRFQDISHPDDLRGEDVRFQTLLSNPASSHSHNKRYIRKDSSVVWVHVTVSLLCDQIGKPVQFIGVVDDITERMRAEEAVHRSEERFRRVVENAPDGILVERGLRLAYANTAALAMFGASSAAELEQRDFLELVSPEDRPAVIERSATVAGRIAVPVQERSYLRCDGQPFPVEVSATPIDYDGQPANLVFLRDIAERKRTEAEKHRLEEQLLQSQKMESLGRLAGGVAHDFNNHLTVITGYCDMMLGRLDADDPMREEIEEIRAAGGRAGSLTQQLLAFSRKQISERKPMNLNDAVLESGKMLRRLIGEQVEIVTHLDPSLGLVVADYGQMIQVLMNLAINARDAMPSGGRIDIETANVELDRSAVAPHKGALPGRYSLLSIADTGAGISAETLPHLFEPFFTTKGLGIGTGLGLSTVYGIVQQSGGWIQVDSGPGAGSRFRIYLPRVEGVVAPPVQIAAAADAPHGAETVLVVEDQAEVRRLAMRILKSNGYALLEASSGPEALEVCRRHTGKIDMLVTDVVMPGMTGRELATRLLKTRPHLKVLYMSGYTADVIGKQGVLDPGVAYLAKPFTPAQLSIKVREVLGQAKAVGRILVVDDDDAVRAMLHQALSEAGYDVQTAADGLRGMRLVSEQEFDVVLTDLIMPDREGIETIRDLRRDYPSIRIIAMSGAMEDIYLKTAGFLGAHVTLRKPIDTQALLRILRELLG